MVQELKRLAVLHVDPSAWAAAEDRPEDRACKGKTGQAKGILQDHNLPEERLRIEWGTGRVYVKMPGGTRLLMHLGKIVWVVQDELLNELCGISAARFLEINSAMD